eukprot:sb/3460651/
MFCGPGKLTTQTCKRRFGTFSRVPVEWIQDGVVDCENGIDEKRDWEMCGNGTTLRIKVDTTPCSNVFLCHGNHSEFLETSTMCSSIQTCDNRACQSARRTVDVKKALSQSPAANVFGNELLVGNVCNKGLSSVLLHMKEQCSEQKFSHPFHQFFGKNLTSSVVTLHRKQDCRYLYGEAYVYYSCTGQCTNADCPLKRPVLHNSCHNLKIAVYSLNTKLSVVTSVFRHKTAFHNNVFVCKNKRCILFERVCDLVDDCGDRSDEEAGCDNSFRCADNSSFLPLSQKCDGITDCKDFSDECNSSCSRKVVEDHTMGMIGFCMGLLGLVLGFPAFVNTSLQKLPEKSGAFVNHVFVLAISFGDLFTPCYLLSLITLHWMKNTDFCVKRLEWISGRSCNFIGVLNTVGATVSSLAMAVISFYRLYGTKRALNYRQSSEVTKELRQKVMLCLLSIVFIALAFALVPLLGALEDWFVNGLVFPRDIALFLGTVDKTQFLQIVYGYYGARYTERSRRKADISWRTIQGMVTEMFSTDYGAVSGKKVSFYDFCCWLPFLICCALHTAEVVDMSPWYQVFSLNILPINSILNPLLYRDTLSKVFDVLRPAIDSICAMFRGAPVLPEPTNEIVVKDSCLEFTSCVSNPLNKTEEKMLLSMIGLVLLSTVRSSSLWDTNLTRDESLVIQPVNSMSRVNSPLPDTFKEVQLCPIANHNGFLVRLCNDDYSLVHETVFQCITSPNVTYTRRGIYDLRTRLTTTEYSLRCPNDIAMYQSCGSLKADNFFSLRNFVVEMFDQPPVCGVVCLDGLKGNFVQKDDQACSDITAGTMRHPLTLQNGSIVEVTLKLGGVCDGICDDIWMDKALTSNLDLTCVEERDCGGGIVYGSISNDLVFMPFQGMPKERTTPPWDQDAPHCVATSEVTSGPKRAIGPHMSSGDFPLYNGSRCFLTIKGRNDYVYKVKRSTYCIKTGLDQTNCTDPAKVGGSCLVKGYPSTISTYVICDGNASPQLCDDGIELKCVRIGRYCYIHKHRLCDGIEDCAGGMDEGKMFCGPGKLTAQTCKRRFGTFSRVPVDWIQDGVVDCENGIDEKRDWEMCGNGTTLRIKVDTTPCSNVFLCHGNHSEFLETSTMCSSTHTCDNRACQSARRTVDVKKDIFQSPAANVFGNELLVGNVCNKGLSSVLLHMKEQCSEHKFSHPFHQFFGKNLTTSVVTLHRKQDCRYLYGEAYVFYSCTGQCTNAECPLKRPVLHNSCHNLKIAVYSLNTELSVVTSVFRHRTAFHNNVFVCKNKRCILFERVCDLVDDCGDRSDEEPGCDNSFRCADNSSFLPLSQKCDGKTDCKDFSDECNSSCSRKVVEDHTMAMVGFVMGVLGLVLGFPAFVNTSLQKLPEKIGAFVNHVFVLAISFGDLFTPCYLLSLITLHWMKSTDFCVKRLEWISGRSCNFIGVLNTVGATVSSLAMAVISFYRLYGTRRALQYRQSSEVTKELRQKVGLCLLSIVFIALAFALVPLLGALEDWFVNGLVFPNDISLFLGTVDKTQFLQIVYGYYGARYTERSRRKADISWRTIQGMVTEMFSTDYGAVSGKKVSFYGNDPVCMFKFFVLSDDPQVVFVWFYISLHFLCFVSVAVCHILIAVLSNKAEVLGANRRTSSRLARKVTLVCVTDFCCWLPFLICCALHTAEVVDMSPWYQVFSLNILPINSILNPLLYRDTLSKVFEVLRPAIDSICAMFRGEPVLPEPTNEIIAKNSRLEFTSCVNNPVTKTEEQFHDTDIASFIEMQVKYPSCKYPSSMMTTSDMIQETGFNSDITTVYDRTPTRRNSN